MKSLKPVQTAAKVLQVLINVALVFVIIGTVFVLLAGGALLSVGEMSETIASMLSPEDLAVFNETFGGSTAAMGTSLLAISVIMIGAAVTLFFASRYFKHELADGTPFTHRGAKELLRVGIIGLAVPAGASLIASIILGVATKFAGGTALDISIEIDLTLGIAALVLSFIFHYGADLEETIGVLHAESAPTGEDREN